MLPISLPPSPPTSRRGRGRKRTAGEGLEANATADGEKPAVPHHLRTLRELIEDNRSGELSRSGRERLDKARTERDAKRRKKREESERQRKDQEQKDAQPEEAKDPTDASASSVPAEHKEALTPLAAAPSAAVNADEPSAGEDGEEEDGEEDEGKEGEGGEEDADAAEVRLSVAPQMKIVNGAIVINEDSLVVPSPSSLPLPFPLLTESPTTRFTSSTFLRHTATLPWSAHETSVFYRALSAYGTDFTLIALLLKGRDRGQVKRKFKKEERENGRLVEEALKRRVRMDVNEFGRMKKEKEDDEEKERREKEETQGSAAAPGDAPKRERIMVRNRQGKRGKGKTAADDTVSEEQKEAVQQSDGVKEGAATAGDEAANDALYDNDATDKG